MAIIGAMLTITGTLALVSLSSVTLLFGFLGVQQLRNHWKYKKNGCNIPMVPEKPFVGSFELGVQHQVRHRLHKEFGPVYYCTQLHVPLFSVADPDIIQYALSRENFPKSTFFQKLEVFWGADLLTMQHGEKGKWKKERRLVDPAFKLTNLKAMHNTFATHAANFTAILLEQSKTTQSFDFTVDICKITLDIISSSGFSYPIQLTDTSRQRNPFIVAINSFLNGLTNPLILLPYGVHLIAHMHRKQRQILDDTFYKVIDERLAALERGERSDVDKDLLDAMLKPDEDGNRLSREELRNELFVFYLAGHETTATVLSWLIYELCRNPDVEKKLIEELETVMGPIDGKTIVTPTPEQVDQLEYMKMTLNETLRIYTPAIGSSRTIPETFEMKGYVFPKGYSISCNFYSTHHDEKLWPDSFKFDPERFSKENSVGRHLYAFTPFSAGPRICIGKNFFYLEAKIILATMLRSLKFELDTTKENGKFNPLDPLVKPMAVWVHAHRRMPTTN